MSLQPIRPFADERVQHKTAVLNGHTYHYLYAAPPSGKWSDTVFLVRFGLSSLAYRVTHIPPGASGICSRKRLSRFTNGAAHSIFTTPLHRTHAHAHHLDHHHDPHHKHILTSSLQIHGWPDLAIGWRYQIPLLLSLGLRVVAPDMMGYGGTVPFPPSTSTSTLPQKRDTEKEIQNKRKEITC
jgi:pimeloyl-ACP methyl ester carboxylesterase